MITFLAQVLFWLSSVSAAISSLTLFHRFSVLPYWVTALLSLLGGAIFGIGMVECFVRLYKINQRFQQEPVNGATGAQITFWDLFMPYIQIGLLAVFAVPSILNTRRKNGLELLLVPDWAVYLPLVLALIMVIAVVHSQALKRRRFI